MNVKRIDCLSVPKSRDLKAPGDDVAHVFALGMATKTEFVVDLYKDHG